MATIDSGTLQGAATDDVVSFKGIPYAAPPVGQLRWRPPQPVARWTGVRQATAFGHDCMQMTSTGSSALGTTPSEDCLYLNVWRPKTATSGSKLPVMVWIYGGAYVVGGTSMPVYDGTQFAKDGVILVSLNYRLGRFGFFAHPALTAAQSSEQLGNYGVMDQIAALKWVQQNIGAFGGDPGNVTVFGESAGGESIADLLTTHLTDGLFQRALIESGNGRVNQTFGRYLQRTSKSVVASGEEQGTTWAQSHGITGSDSTALAKLRALSANDVLDGLGVATMSSATGVATFSGGPMIDGTVVTDEPEVRFENGNFQKVSLMIGTNNKDLGFSTAVTSKDDAYALFGASNLAAARAAFDPNGTATVSDVESEISRVITMFEPARFVARMFASSSLAAYQYRFSYVAQSKQSTSMGAVHGDEIPYVFNTLGASYGTAVTAQDQQVADLVHGYVVSFAKTGNPNGGNRATWAAYNTGNDNLLEFTSAATVQAHQPDWLKSQLDLVEPLNEANTTVNRQFAQ
ncbi:carboxylesterase/lipase family protein [Burkholderia sp. MR1-5-21]